MAPEIAIVNSNTLSCLGLQNLLKEIIPMATIRTFHSFAELMDDTPDMYAHYFISSQIYLNIRLSFWTGNPKPSCWQTATTSRNFQEYLPWTSTKMKKV